jgi:hypothetical protein
MRASSGFGSRDVLLISVLLGSFVVGGGGTAGASEEDAQDAKKPWIPKPRWELLLMTPTTDIPLAEQRLIKRVNVVLPGTKTVPRGIAGEAGILYESDDAHVLLFVRQALLFPLRHAIESRSDGSDGGGGVIVGKIVVTTTQDEFTITVTRSAFSLGENAEKGSEEGTFQTYFYSWGLAHFIDDLCARQAHAHIDAKVMRRLTGEWRMERDKEALLELRNARSGAESRRGVAGGKREEESATGATK